VLKASRIPDSKASSDIAIHGPSYVWTGRRTQPLDAELDLVPMPNDANSDMDFRWVPEWLGDSIGWHTEVLPLMFGAIFGGSLFGGIHCLAWNSQFPTPTETLLGRIYSVITAAVPILALPFMAFWARTPYPTGRRARPIGALFLFPYILRRVFLIVEMFRSLFFLPPDAFVSTWSGSLPHWG
jgi:hypothetical protein